MSILLQAPFPYFGGKSAIADKVWQLLGDVRHYIEPFFGSGAVLLSRANYDPALHIETVCDLDGHIANVWRSIQYSPDETAKWCDYPVNHVCLHARKKKLMESQASMLDNLVADEMWHDPKLAGYWIWGTCCWIGAGFLAGGGDDDITADAGIRAPIPFVSDRGTGVHKLGIRGKRPHLSSGSVGVHKLGISGGRPHIGHAGVGVHKINMMGSKNNPAADLSAPYTPKIYTWFRALSERLRRVRVVCGSWERVCGGDWQSDIGTAGIFFDPPYGVAAGRRGNLYQQDSLYVSDDVRAWAIERGRGKNYRIVIAGYYDEHKSLLDEGWDVMMWKAGGGYGNQSKCGNDNRHKECLFYSPHCLTVGKQANLFYGEEVNDE